MRLTIGRKISIAMAIMIMLVVISALTANLSIISIQKDVCDMVNKSSPLITATQAMVASKARAGAELHKYINEDDLTKLVEIEKHCTRYITDHDLYEQKICKAIKDMPYENMRLMNIWEEGMKTITPQFNDIAGKIFKIHPELVQLCDKRMEIMRNHKKCSLKLLKLLTELQHSYSNVDQIRQPTLILKTIHAKMILTGRDYLSCTGRMSPEEKMNLRKDFVCHSQSFTDMFKSLKIASLNYNIPKKFQAIEILHKDFVNTTIGRRQLFDLYEKEHALMENQLNLINQINKLELNDLEVAANLLEVASDDLNKKGSAAYQKANNITNIMIGFCIFALVVSVLVMRNLSKRIVKPVLDLADASNKIATGNLYQKIDVSCNDEIGDLCKSFNMMSENLHSEVLIRKKAEKERRELLKILEEKNRELQNVVYVASHDLRSPLVTINGFSKELGALCSEMENIIDSENIDENFKNKIKPLIKEDIPEDLKFINAGAKKMQTLIGGLLQISRAGTTEVELTALDMNEVLKNICQAMQYNLSTRDITIEIGNLPPCYGDANMINQVFSNLLDNAVKYGNNNGNDWIIVSGWYEKNNSIYCVEDNGIGIPAGNQAKIFEIFHRLDPHGPVSGEGLGLTIISRILDRHNGKIWVESEPGAGSKFYVSIPSKPE